MPWVEFTGPFSWRVSAKRGRVVIAYEAGMILNVTRECAQAAKNAGKAVPSRNPDRHARPADDHVGG